MVRKEALEWLAVERGVSDSLEVRGVEVPREPPKLFEEFGAFVEHEIFSILGLDGLVSIWQPNVL